MNESNLAEVLDEAVEVETPEQPTKKARKPRAAKHTAEGETPAAEKAPRVRKPKLVAQLDEEGNPVLDEEGNPVMVEAPKKERKAKEPKQPKYLLDDEGNPVLDEEGNPVLAPAKPRVANVFLDSQVITLTEKGKTTVYREGSKRQQHFSTIYDGMTVGQYYEVNGGKAASHRYLVHQLNVLGTINID